MQRREFIKIGGTGLAGAGLLGGLTSDWYDLYGAELPDPGTDADTLVPTFCELCFWKCGVLAHVRDGRVTKITGNPNDPLSGGRLCPRGAGGTGLLYDPDRLVKPLVRVDRRGSQEFEAVSWDAALNETAERLTAIKARYGAGALALFSHGFGGGWVEHLFKAMGTPNVLHPSYSQCRGPRDVGFELTFGEGVGSPEVTDMGRAGCIVLIGSHLGENMHNTQVQDFAEGLRNGADLIVVDPRYSTAASKADHWLPIRPGADTALLLAWMHVLLTEDLYDREYIEAYAYGFEQLRAHVEPLSPEWAYPRTGIEPDVIRKTARMMAASRPATVVHPGRRVTWYGDDTQRSRAVALLNALLGSWGRSGGMIRSVRYPLAADTYPPYPEPDGHPRDRVEEGTYPLGHALSHGIRDASLPGEDGGDPQVRAWMVYGSNLPTTLPQPEETYRAMQELDFLVTVDVLPAEIVGWSDVVLPEATYLERHDNFFAPWHREAFASLRQPAVEPLGESKPGWWIARELGLRMGLDEYFPWETAEEYLRERAARSGFDYDRMTESGTVRTARSAPITFEDGAPPEFYTDSGKIELYSPKLAGLGFDPIPTFRDEEVEDPPTGYYRMLFGRAPMHTFGRTVNNRLLSQFHDENAVWVNSAVARQWGLADGERVHLKNQDGVVSTFSAPVKVTERLRPDCVYLVHGYGRKARGLTAVRGKGIDDAELITRVKVDPIMGGTGMNVNFVTFLRPEAAVEARAARDSATDTGTAAEPAAVGEEA